MYPYVNLSELINFYFTLKVPENHRCQMISEEIDDN